MVAHKIFKFLCVLNLLVGSAAYAGTGGPGGTTCGPTEDIRENDSCPALIRKVPAGFKADSDLWKTADEAKDDHVKCEIAARKLHCVDVDSAAWRTKIADELDRGIPEGKADCADCDALKDENAKLRAEVAAIRRRLADDEARMAQPPPAAPVAPAAPPPPPPPPPLARHDNAGMGDFFGSPEGKQAFGFGLMLGQLLGRLMSGQQGYPQMMGGQNGVPFFAQQSMPFPSFGRPYLPPSYPAPGGVFGNPFGGGGIPSFNTGLGGGLIYNGNVGGGTQFAAQYPVMTNGASVAPAITRYL